MKAYILKISFENISPLIWRRVILPADVTFNRLHETIQHVTNFQSELSPYHSFAVEIEDYFITNNESILDEYKGKKFAGKTLKQPARMKIDSFLQNHGSFIYTYDFGDDWKIHVSLEEAVEDYYFGYPTLLDGEGMAPPEDVGGPPGFESFKNVYADPTHPDYTSTVAWAESQSYLPLDIASVNERLKFVKYKKTEWEFIDHENYIVKSDKYRSADQVNLSQLPNKEKVVQYAIACANLYGYIKYPKFLEIYNDQNETNISSSELQALLTDSQYAKQLEKAYVNVQAKALVHDAIVTSGDLTEFLQRTEGKPYYVPSNEELLRYVDDSYYEKTSLQEQFMMKLAEDFFGGSTIMIKNELDDLIGQLQVMQSNSKVVMQEFFRRFEMKDKIQINEYAYMITMIANTTRLWENRGHSPAEIFQMEKPHLIPLTNTTVNNKLDKKVGRNDPCPCGSGKKYKKCCGK